MAQITITIPDDKAVLIGNACAEFNGWTTESGITKAQNVKKVVIDDLRQIVRNYEANIAASTARVAKETEINAISIT